MKDFNRSFKNKVLSRLPRIHQEVSNHYMPDMGDPGPRSLTKALELAFSKRRYKFWHAENLKSVHYLYQRLSKHTNLEDTVSEIMKLAMIMEVTLA